MAGNNQKPQLSWNDKLTVGMQTASPLKVAAWSGVIFCLIIGAVLIAMSMFDASFADGVGLFVACALAGVFFGVVMAWSTGKYHRTLDEQLGHELSGQDRADLILWMRKGIKPQAEHLQPVLPKYVQYMEDRITGQSQIMPPPAQWSYFLLNIALVGINLAQIISGDYDFFNFMAVPTFSLLAIMYFPEKNKYTKAFLAKLNAWQMRKLAVMRSQL